MPGNKLAVIYGGDGAIGGAVARAFASAGASVYVVGRTEDGLEAVANDIGDAASVAELDALDERAVAEHVDAVAADAGGIDIALDAVSFPHVQGSLFAELAVEDVMHPIDTFLRTTLITAKAVARHMMARRSGTILTLSTAGSRHAPPGVLGYEIAESALVDLIQADPIPDTCSPGLGCGAIREHRSGCPSLLEASPSGGRLAA